MPLQRLSCNASTPGQRAAKQPTSLRLEAAKLRARSALVVPPDFGGLLRIHTLQVCCTLQPILGFAWFSEAVELYSKGVLSSRIRPHRRPTLQSFPLACSRVASPRPLPPRRSTKLLLVSCRCCHQPVTRFYSAADLEALLHNRVRCQNPCVAAWVLPDAFLGFVPQDASPLRHQLRREARPFPPALRRVLLGRDEDGVAPSMSSTLCS
jgi:hypothetical protein